MWDLEIAYIAGDVEGANEQNQYYLKVQRIVSAVQQAFPELSHLQPVSLAKAGPEKHPSKAARKCTIFCSLS